MRRVFMVRYKVKPDQAANNEQLIRSVFEELQITQPDGIRYSTFRLDDGVTFVNLVVTETEGGLGPLGQLKAYRQIQEGKFDRFDGGAPIISELHEIGDYRVFAD
jgi:hypothetical protein